MSVAFQLLVGLSPFWAAGALFLTGLIIATDAMLLSGVLRMFGRSVPFVTALLYSLVGWFFSNVETTDVREACDIFRGVQLSRVGVPVGQSIRLIIAIRLLSFTTLVAVMLAGFPIALRQADDPSVAALLGTVLVCGALAVVILFLLACGIVRLQSLNHIRSSENS
jgi:hypothetical protein